MTKLGAHIRKSARTPSRSQLVKMRVVVSGLRGVGVEAAKNLALAGPREVILHDPALVEARAEPDEGRGPGQSCAHVNKTEPNSC